ncbi:MAG: DHH family phosphoesterase [Thermoplasmata archaeon]|nr:DHH family phosphoesterase [Thermoplasmata archaeon]
MMMRKRAREVAHTLVSAASDLNHLPFYIVSHADADGITAAAIIARILHAYKITPSLIFTNSTEINEIVYHGTIKPAMKSQADARDGIWIFTDTGTGSLQVLEKFRKKIIIDHHGNQNQIKKSQQSLIPRSVNHDSWTVLYSPHLFGHEPDSCTAAFLAYLIAKNVHHDGETGALAVIGALGDGINAGEFTISGLAREAVSEAVAADAITIKKDLVVPGKETLSVVALLAEMNQMLKMGFDTDEFLREISSKLRIQQKDLEKDRWIDLSPKEKRRILSWIAKRRLKEGHSPDAVLGMVGEVYHLKRHSPGRHLHDCAEFGKLLNECGEKELAHDGYCLCHQQTEEKYREVIIKLYLR